MKNLFFTLILLIPLAVCAKQLKTAKAGELVKGKYTSYITASGDTLNIGDALNIGRPSDKTFLYITQNNQYCSTVIANQTVEISKFKVYGPGKYPKMYIGFGGYGVPCWIDYESAILEGEVKK